MDSFLHTKSIYVKEDLDKILLIDYYNALWRACIKFGPKLDVPDEVLFTFNFFRNLRPLIEKFSPSKVFFALERSSTVSL